MKTKIMLLLILLLSANFAQAGPVSTAFTYQGRLNLNGAPITGSVDLQFYLYDAQTAGNMIAGGLE